MKNPLLLKPQWANAAACSLSDFLVPMSDINSRRSPGSVRASYAHPL